MEIINDNIDDILDIKGKNNNFLTDKPYSQEYIDLALKWSKLPMYKDKNSVKKFFDLLHNCNVILLISGTGSGKTVLVPKFVIKYMKIMKLEGKIAITNPKISTTIYNAEYGAKTLDIKLGEEVGYKYKGSPSDSITDKSKLIYCTDGLILATILSGDKLLKDYQGIIIDEAHERHIQIDILLKLIKDIIKQRPDFKLIIMSATINSSTFRDYFNTTEIKYGEIEVSGESNYAITQNWLDKKIKISRSNYIDLAVDRCLNIIDTTEIGDIIVFVPIINDAKKGCQILKSKCPSTLKIKNNICDKLFCVEVFGKMKDADKTIAVSKDLYKSKGFDRKIIFATNVAESSITFEGITHVIDTGYELGKYYDYVNNSEVITIKYTSQAQIKQRIGRAGRTQPGISYHLYTTEAYNKFSLYPIPNISVIDLTDHLISLLKYSKTLKNIVNLMMDLITVPKIDQFIVALYKLYFIKCIKLVKAVEIENSSDENLLLQDKDIKWNNMISYNNLNSIMNGTLTTVGYNILKFRSSPILSAYCIILSYYMKCQKEIIQIMAICEISNGQLKQLFDYNKKELKNVQDYFKPYIHIGSDHITVFNIYNKLYINKQVKYLNKKLFSSIEKRIIQLEKYATSINEKRYIYMKEKYKIINKDPYNDIIDNIIYVLGISYQYNLIKKVNKITYQSLNFFKNSTANIEYCEIMPTNIQYTDYAICNTFVSAFGNKSFQCITQIPKHIMQNINK